MNGMHSIDPNHWPRISFLIHHRIYNKAALSSLLQFSDSSTNNSTLTLAQRDQNADQCHCPQANMCCLKVGMGLQQCLQHKYVTYLAFKRVRYNNHSTHLPTGGYIFDINNFRYIEPYTLRKKYHKHKLQITEKSRNCSSLMKRLQHCQHKQSFFMLIQQHITCIFTLICI